MNVTDDDLVLYHYGDGLSDSKRGAITAALTTDTGLAQRLERLVAQMQAFPVQGASIDPVITARLRASLDAAASARASPAVSLFSAFKPTWKLGFALAAGTTALVVFTAGYLNRRGDLAPEVTAAGPAPAQTAAVEPDEFSVNPMRFERRLAWYLTETEQQLNEIHQVNASERSLLLTRAIVQNRVIEKAADRAARTQYARALRAFGPLLEGISQEGVDASELDAGVSQLKFELRVLQARLGASGTLLRT